MCVGRDRGNGCAGFSDLQTEELPLLKAQVVKYQVQQNQAFIQLLKDGKHKRHYSQPNFVVAYLCTYKYAAKCVRFDMLVIVSGT